MRLEVECPEPAAGKVWPVQIDFRALAGEIGAFNVRSARLLPLTDTDQAGPEQPCQLLSGGIAFVTEPGSHSYFLYLDPLPGPDLGFREARASQSRSEVRLQNRWLRLSLSSTDGFLTAWQIREPELELLPAETGEGSRVSSDRQDQRVPEEIGPIELPSQISRPEWRLRVLETGPLLARARAEHPEGHLRQFDLAAGQYCAEMSVNSPWNEFFLPVPAALWPAGGEALFGQAAGFERRPMREGAIELPAVRWAALHRVDGLTVALALPEAPADAIVDPSGLRLRGRPHGGRVLLFAGLAADPAAALTRLLSAAVHPPQVRLGIIEERRVREF
jgi:hypothetical protein